MVGAQGLEPWTRFNHWLSEVAYSTAIQHRFYAAVLNTTDRDAALLPRSTPGEANDQSLRDKLLRPPFPLCSHLSRAKQHL
jgi:hypothetical protein